MELGPAFIQQYIYPWMIEDDVYLRRIQLVPDGYIYQPATIGTAAGWVRPKGKLTKDGN